jgi:hypothetical protein
MLLFLVYSSGCHRAVVVKRSSHARCFLPNLSQLLPRVQPLQREILPPPVVLLLLRLIQKPPPKREAIRILLPSKKQRLVRRSVKSAYIASSQMLDHSISLDHVSSFPQCSRSRSEQKFHVVLHRETIGILS